MLKVDCNILKETLHRLKFAAASSVFLKFLKFNGNTTLGIAFSLDLRVQFLYPCHEKYLMLSKTVNLDNTTNEN